MAKVQASVKADALEDVVGEATAKASDKIQGVIEKITAVVKASEDFSKELQQGDVGEAVRGLLENLGVDNVLALEKAASGADAVWSLLSIFVMYRADTKEYVRRRAVMAETYLRKYKDAEISRGQLETLLKVEAQLLKGFAKAQETRSKVYYTKMADKAFDLALRVIKEVA